MVLTFEELTVKRSQSLSTSIHKTYRGLELEGILETIGSNTLKLQVKKTEHMTLKKRAYAYGPASVHHTDVWIVLTEILHTSPSFSSH